MSRGLISRLSGLVAMAGGLGLLVGAVRGFRYVLEGFGLLAVDEIRHWLLLSLGGGLVFALLYLASSRLFGWRGFRGSFLAAVLCSAPLLAFAGWEANRAWGIRPSALLTPFALERNLALVGVAVLLAGLAALWLSRRPDDDEGPEPPSRVGLYAALGLAGLTLVVHLGLAWAFHRPTAGDPQPPMLVLLLDAVRPDRLSCYGNARPTSPAIDSLARDGVTFSQAVASSTFTKSSIASLFTGRYPFQHGLYWGSHVDEAGQVRSDVLAEGETTLAEVLRRHGYLTQSWVQNSHLEARFGFDQGFVDYRHNQGQAPRITARLKRWLGGPGRRYGFFGYVHFIDVHDPYLPKPPYDSMFGAVADPYRDIDLAEWGAYLDEVRAGRVKPSTEQVEGWLRLYDGQIRFLDDHVGEILAQLKSLDLYDRMLIVVLSDHGDGFMEHGFVSHSTTPYDELARVPLIVKFPSNSFAGRVVEEQVRLVDVMPTLMELARVREPLELAGCSLMPLLDPTSRNRREAECGNAVIEIAEAGAAPVVAVRDGRFKYIWHEKKPHELYDLVADPGERVNLIAAVPPEAEAVQHRAELAVAARALLTRGEQIELDEKTIRELKALGYLK